MATNIDETVACLQAAMLKKSGGVTLADLAALQDQISAAAFPQGRVSLEEANHYSLRYCNSYTRLPSILRLKRLMAPAEWWELLGEQWSVCDNIASEERRLRRLLQRALPTDLAFMMTSSERDGLRRLPNPVTVYRGCYGVNRRGLSWSLSKATAMRFPTLNRYARLNDVPLLLEGRVARSRCVMKLDRSEDEIISGVVRSVGEEQIKTAA